MIRRSLLQATVVFFIVVTLCTVAVGSAEAASGQTTGVLQTDNAQMDGEQTQSHENPAEATEPDDDEGIESHLESMLSDHLADSTDDAVDGDYEDAHAALDDAYDERLDQYAEVAGDDRAELYDDARNRQQDFIDSSEQFDDRREAYREARQDGDTERADELQDGLQDDAADSQASGDELISAYRTLESETGIDHSEKIELIERRQQAVDQFVSQTEEAGQVNTVLLVETDRTTVSFDDPPRINGQLLTAAGEPIAEQDVTVAVEGRPYSVETDSAGQFDIVHRPVESVGETTLDIEYRPAETSEYRATQREIPVTVEPVDATVRIEPTESAASFETDLTVEGTVVAGSLNQPAAELPVGLFVDGQELATTDTNETGDFSFSTAIPRSVDSGTSEIEVRTLETDGAIRSASETTQVQIEPVSTRLGVETDTDIDETAPEALTVRGQLETADGEPIPDAAVDLTVDDETVETVTTADDGTFEGTVTLPETVDGRVTIGASFSATGHLDPTTETITLDVSADADAGIQPAPTQQDAEPAALGVPIRELLLAAGSMLALFGLVGLWWVWRDGRMSPDAADDEALGESTPTESTAPESPKTTPASSSKLRSFAEQQLDAGSYNHAVVLAYAAVRRQLGTLLGTPDAATHRELAQSYAVAESAHDHREPLEELTQQYEQVRYAADPVDEPTAARAVSMAERILDDLEQTDHDD